MTTSERRSAARVRGGAEDMMLSLDGGDLHVRRDGPRDAPALLLVHGSAASTRSWDALVPLLTPSHHVVLVDLPGHGRSPEPAGHGHAVPGQARTVGAALDRLGVRHAVVGHSGGGYTATALAEQRPDLVTALALVNTGPRPDAFAGQASAAIEPALWPPSDEQVRLLASTAFRDGFPVPQELVDDVRGMTFQAFTGSSQASPAYPAERSLPDRLAALGKPLHVIFGDRDRRWRPGSAADYRVVPGAHVEYLPGSGHTPIIEDPQRTAALLLDFAKAQCARAE
ncbi:alpha/beta fold hydrolase [Streptomyces sp. NPDC059785]|uniref:alpha/beta fold hydrolase n=1 Tax=Streptomyces sp. NPDC059785 TaxID=3346945 RepID=UPI00366288EE